MDIQFGEIKNDIAEVFRGKTFCGYITVLPDDVMFSGNSIEEVEQILAKMKELQKNPQEGDRCVHSDCDGIFEYTRQEPCSCHVSPPCSSCVDAPLICNKCGHYSDEE